MSLWPSKNVGKTDQRQAHTRLTPCLGANTDMDKPATCEPGTLMVVSTSTSRERRTAKFERAVRRDNKLIRLNSQNHQRRRETPRA
jgi:hypothetical protein